MSKNKKPDASQKQKTNPMKQPSPPSMPIKEQRDNLHEKKRR